MIRTLILPAALVTGLGFASAPEAQAHPMDLSAVAGATSLGGLRIGVGVGIPIGGGRPVYHSQPTGYWATQTVPVTVPVQVAYQVPYQTTVQVPDHVIGVDAYGRPLWSYRTELRTELRTEYRTEMRTQYMTQQVWVPTGHQVVHHGYSRPWGRVGVGLGVGFRIR